MNRHIAAIAGCIAAALMLSSCGGGPPPIVVPTSNSVPVATGATTTLPSATPPPAAGAQVTIPYHTSTGNLSFGFTAMQPQLLPQVGQQPANPGEYWLYIVVDVYNLEPDRSELDPSGALRATIGGCDPNGDTCVDCVNQDAAGNSCTPNYFHSGDPQDLFICASDTENHNGLIPANSDVETDLCVTQVATMPADLELWFPDGDQSAPTFYTQYTRVPVPQ